MVKGRRYGKRELVTEVVDNILLFLFESSSYLKVCYDDMNAKREVMGVATRDEAVFLSSEETKDMN